MEGLNGDERVSRGWGIRVNNIVVFNENGF